MTLEMGREKGREDRMGIGEDNQEIDVSKNLSHNYIIYLFIFKCLFVSLLPSPNLSPQANRVSISIGTDIPVLKTTLQASL